MAENGNTPIQHNTEVKIIHDDGSWSNTVRSIFIYGTGALRLYLTKAGTPSTRAFVIASTLGTDVLYRAVNNTVNDPNYVKNHYDSWRYIWKNSAEGVVKVQVDTETAERLNQALLNNNLIPDNSGMDDISNKILKFIMNTVGSILEPVASTYSTEVLATQIYHISILLYLLSLFITILIFFLLVNILVVINSERILKFFSNKYIRWYVNINLKLISLEVFLLGGSILIYMQGLSNGLHYIATHPIII